MRINGSWLVCKDGGIRPVIRIEVLLQSGTRELVYFLVDTGADRTVFDAGLLELFQGESRSPGESLEGIGGRMEAVKVETELQFTTDQGQSVVFKGSFNAFPQSDALDMCVLGRDITNLFSVIVDRPRDVVCLLNQRHSYNIVQS